MLPAGSPGHAQYGPSGIHIPIRRPHPCKGRHNINAAVIRYLLGKILGIRRFCDKSQLIPHPLDYRACHKHAALQGVAYFSVYPHGNRGQEPVFALYHLISGVHQQKTAGTISVFGFPLGKTCLSEQRRLLIPGDACDRHLHPLDIDCTVHLAGISHLRQHRHRDIQLSADALIPAQVLDIVQHGAGGVGVVGNMYFTSGELPDKPAVHRAEQHFSPLGLFPRAGHMIQDPLHLRSGKIRIHQKAGLFLDICG